MYGLSFLSCRITYLQNMHGVDHAYQGYGFRSGPMHIFCVESRATHSSQLVNVPERVRFLLSGSMILFENTSLATSLIKACVLGYMCVNTCIKTVSRNSFGVVDLLAIQYGIGAVSSFKTLAPCSPQLHPSRQFGTCGDALAP